MSTNYNQRGGYGHQTGQHSGQPPQYNEGQNNRGQPPPYNNTNNNNQSPYGKNTNSSYDGVNTLDSSVRYLILSVILFTYTLFNFIPMAIYSDNGFFDDDEIFNARLAGFIIAFIGAAIVLLSNHFNINGCMTNNQQIINRIAGAFIIIGGLILLITNCVNISDSADGNLQCEDDEYICCTCLEIAFIVFLGNIMTIIIGIDIASDIGRNQKARVGSFIVIYMLAILFFLVEYLANNDIDNFSDIEKSQIAGMILILIFGLLALIAGCIGNKPMMKYVGIGFGGSVLLSLYIIDLYSAASILTLSVDVVNVMYLGIGGFITYDLVA